MKKYVVTLRPEEREQLSELANKGKGSARRRRAAQVLLKADRGCGWTDERIAEAFGVAVRTVERIRERFVEEGLERTLDPPRQPRAPQKIDGDVEARLVTLACSAPPSGRQRSRVAAAGRQAGRTGRGRVDQPRSGAPDAQKNELKPWQKRCWCLPGPPSGEFVCAMEDVLEVYKLPYDPEIPVVCLDEAQKQLVAEVRPPTPARPGQPERFDAHYVRAGVCQLFLVVEPLRGWRHVEVRQHKAARDWAEVVRMLLTRHDPRAPLVRLIVDNLNTHAGGALYQAFGPAEARALYQRLELHYTPKHASWLNMAEIELSALARQCLNRRLDTLTAVKREVSAWQTQRNRERTKINWQFTTTDARTKLRRLYPTYEG